MTRDEAELVAGLVRAEFPVWMVNGRSVVISVGIDDADVPWKGSDLSRVTGWYVRIDKARGRVMDGSFDGDICPVCGDGGLTHVRAGEWYDDENDHVFCFRCEFHKEWPAVARHDRPGATKAGSEATDPIAESQPVLGRYDASGKG